MTNNFPPGKKPGDELQKANSTVSESYAGTPVSTDHSYEDPPDKKELIDPMIPLSAPNTQLIDPIIPIEAEKSLSPPVYSNDVRAFANALGVPIPEGGAPSPYRNTPAVSREAGNRAELPLSTVPAPQENNYMNVPSYNLNTLVRTPSQTIVSAPSANPYLSSRVPYTVTEDRYSSVASSGTQYSHRLSDAEVNALLRNCVNKSRNSQLSQTQEYYTPVQGAVSRFNPDSSKYPDTVSGNYRNFGTKSGTQPEKLYVDFRDITNTLPPAEKLPEKKKPKPNDTAQKFMQMYPILTVGADIYLYEGTRYQRRSELDVERRIVQYCSDDVKEAGNPKFVSDVCKCLLQSPYLAREELKINQDIVSFRNGVLNLEDVKLYKHHFSFVTISTVECNYNPQADCPVFHHFLRQITGGDAVLIERIWQTIGYLLTTRDDAKALFVFQGYSNTGKSLFGNLLSSMINREAVSNLDVDELDEMFSVSQLYEKVLCFSADMPAAPLEAKVVSKLKQLTGFDTVAANVKHKDHIQFRSYTKFILTTNHPIYFKGNEEALLNRMVTIPFVYTIPPEQQDKNLLKKLLAEKDGIAARAMEAFFRLKANNYIFPGEYRLNEIFMNGMGNEPVYSVDSCIERFVIDYLMAAPEAGVYTSDAHKAFEAKFGAIPFQSFSQYYNSAVTRIYNAVKTRKRMEGEKNPVSYYKGVCLKR